ncbi:MAG TPA: RluA family pseudouridine synthase [Solirubrobacteraceae bacterium]|jgi:23S rRNA pseudouridine1911/1915/1917 synthase|nr:RluA family pseudouridine synthase [Solirubrobacteraceae bacterium]
MPEIEWQGTVGADAAGLRLDQFLADHLGSRARAARLISAGLVEVDGRTVPKRFQVAGGEQVVARGPDAVAPSVASGPQTADYAVAYEDDALIVIDKAAGVVVHPARGHESGTLAQALADRAAGGEDPYRAGIVHRLDRDTSGLLVVAKSDAVHRRLKALLEARELRREYLTLVDGIPPAHAGTIDAPIGRDRRDRVLHSIDTDTPRDARTHFELLEPLAHEALLRVTLETGRTHQIRVHMGAIGHPVLGDQAYGGAVRFGLRRQFLHAARLAFPHPQTGAEIDVSSPLPADLEAALELARAQMC